MAYYFFWEQKNHEDLLFSNIQKAAILKATIKEPHQSILSDAKKSGKLPQGPFKIVEHENLVSEIEALELNLSSNYFGDLVKKESGVSALDYIQTAIINRAKDKMLESNKSVSEVAYELGFRYSQHFTRLFKLKVGVPPTQYKRLVNN